ncbi:MAG: type II secretion system F family protein [Candidatus Omnitrophica bacterium]|nr:type II secretion system F family protein [Candidatus Omnitrophota bacterium]
MESTFHYKARDKFGAIVNGVTTAADPVAVASQLKQKGWTPLEIGTKPRAFPVGLATRIRGLKIADVNAFTREFYTLHKAGLTVLASLEVISEQDRSSPLHSVAQGLLKNIRGGASISESLARYPKAFNALYVSMFEAGEASGRLEQVLKRLVELGEGEEKLRMRIKAALRYPLIVVIAIFGAFLFLTNFIIPRFAQLFASRNVVLPLPTRLLLAVHYAMAHYGWLIALLTVVGLCVFFRAKRTPGGKLLWDRFMLKLPVFGPLILMAEMARFSHMMALLVQSGVPVTRSLEIARKSADNNVIANAIEVIRKGVTGGSGIEQPMRETGVFPPAVIRMVRVGEETGKIDELLLRVSEYYDMQVDYRVSNLMVLIEPALIVLLGGMVGVMALGMFLPMWNMISLFRS